MEKNNIIGIYDDEDVLVKAIHYLRENGVKIKNIFLPFPVHGVFEALKLKTRLPQATFIYGVIGVAFTFAFLYWASVVNYPLKFGGKPLNTLSFIIIMFVVTILISTVLTFTTFFIRQNIGPGKKAVMYDSRTTDDKFVIVIDKEPEMKEDEISKINRVLRESGAIEVEEKTELPGMNEKQDKI
jgi:hypothetical protein